MLCNASGVIACAAKSHVVAHFACRQQYVVVVVVGAFAATFESY